VKKTWGGLGVLASEKGVEVFFLLRCEGDGGDDWDFVKGKRWLSIWFRFQDQIGCGTEFA
jgi:hypothetical protein